MCLNYKSMIFVEKVVIEESCDRLIIKNEFLYVLIYGIMVSLRRSVKNEFFFKKWIIWESWEKHLWLFAGATVDGLSDHDKDCAI